MKTFSSLWKKRKGAMLAAGAVLLAVLGFGAFRLAHPAPSLPTAVVQRGEFVDYVQIRGQAQAKQSVTIAAPFNVGDLQIIQIAANGSEVKKGALVVQFDTTTMQQTLAQDRADVKSADAAIDQSRAKARLKEEQDLTDVMKARYDVQSAKLDASKSEILSQIAGEEAQLQLTDAGQKLKEMEEKLKADKASDAADIASEQQKREQAEYQVNQTQRSLGQLTLRAPQNGMVTMETNWRAAGPMGAGAPFKQGDRAWPGAAIAELPDLSTMEMNARIDETQRGQVQVGQAVTIQVDAIPDRQFTGHVALISTMASTDFNAGWPFPRDFSMDIALDSTDPRLRPGMSATLRVAVDRVPNGIIIPAEALFHKAGAQVAYVLHGSRFDARAIEVARKSGDQLLIAHGLEPGDRVALKDPTATP